MHCLLQQLNLIGGSEGPAQKLLHHLSWRCNRVTQEILKIRDPTRSLKLGKHGNANNAEKDILGSFNVKEISSSQKNTPALGLHSLDCITNPILAC